MGLAGRSAGLGGNASGDREAHVRERDGSYSRECVEGSFSEVRLGRVLRSSPKRVPRKFGGLWQNTRGWERIGKEIEQRKGK